MHVAALHHFAELAPWRAAWDALAGGCVFRRWTWLEGWWRHYGANNPRRELRVFVVERSCGAGPIAILPCYVERRRLEGVVLRLLGDGEVCSDHLGLLAARADAGAAAAALAEHLLQRDDWDLIDFAAVDVQDAPTTALRDALAAGGCLAETRDIDSCWIIDLPESWDEFLAAQSKSHRKQLRQLERRVLDSDRARWHVVQTADQFADAWQTLVDLHQRRRQSLGQPGCFASPAWAAFHRETAAALASEGCLRLSYLELDGRPIAAEYHLAAGGTVYAYQGGIDPARLADEPGQLSNLAAIRQALAEGCHAFDFLRGDEPYKAHWRAEPRSVVQWRAAAPRTWAELRQRTLAQAWRLGRLAKRLAHRS